jgi:hypothetical protein
MMDHANTLATVPANPLQNLEGVLIEVDEPGIKVVDQHGCLQPSFRHIEQYLSMRFVLNARCARL